MQGKPYAPIMVYQLKRWIQKLHWCSRRITKKDLFVESTVLEMTEIFVAPNEKSLLPLLYRLC